SSTIKIELTVTGSPTITWLWGDGTSTLGGAQVTHNFSSNTTSYVVIDLSFFYLKQYPSNRSNLTNLTYAAMVGCTNASTNTIDAWFNDLAAAQTNISQITGNFYRCSDSPATFYCPAKTSSASTNSQSI